jgi:diaminohydroxyphosphoribosylaminopyrimidine deaminase/5-amino-6-(5-phosphoribosylamino)uracil reductase
MNEDLMRLALAEAEHARGSTGDNPWVGCIIATAAGEILGRGFTRGPGEDHAEIGALRDADARGLDVRGATMFSTLEPCSFHGRTPACSRAIVARGLGRLVFAMRDPNPRVDGEGARILREGGVDVVEGVLEADVRRQLGRWVLAHHPHEIVRRARLLEPRPPAEIVSVIAALYAIDRDQAARVLREQRTLVPSPSPSPTPSHNGKRRSDP